VQTVISMDKLRNRWIDEGVVVIEDLFDVSEIKKVQIDFEKMYGDASQSEDRYEANHTGSESELYKNQFEFIDTLPFQASVDMNLLSLHPKLIDLSRKLLNSADIQLYQSHTWAKFGERADYNQYLHCDFNNHTLTVPPIGINAEAVNYLIYLSDVGEENGPFRYVNKKDSNKVLGDRCLNVDKKKYFKLEEKEKPVYGKAGTVIAYSLDTFHRGTNLTKKKGHRYSMSVSYKLARTNSIGFHVWQVSPKRDWSQIINNGSPDQLGCLGIPLPGSSFWNEITIKQTEARWPGWNAKPYKERI